MKSVLRDRSQPAAGQEHLDAAPTRQEQAMMKLSGAMWTYPRSTAEDAVPQMYHSEERIYSWPTAAVPPGACYLRKMTVVMHFWPRKQFSMREASHHGALSFSVFDRHRLHASACQARWHTASEWVLCASEHSTWPALLALCFCVQEGVSGENCPYHPLHRLKSTFQVGPQTKHFDFTQFHRIDVRVWCHQAVPAQTASRCS